MAQGLIVSVNNQKQAFAIEQFDNDYYDIKPYSWRTKLKIHP